MWRLRHHSLRQPWPIYVHEAGESDVKRTLKVVCQVEVGSVSRIVQISETWGIDQKPPLPQRWSEVSIVGPGTYNSEYKEHMVRILIQQ